MNDDKHIPDYEGWGPENPYEDSADQPFGHSGKPAGPSPLPMVWSNEIKPVLHGNWLVKKLIPAEGLCVVYGHPGCGKSFLAINISWHVALGWEWMGRKVRQGLVVYVAAEDGSGVQNRIAALQKHHRMPNADVPLVVVPCLIDMQSPTGDMRRLVEAIKTATERANANPKKRGEIKPALVVVDTISKTFGAGKENTDDMAAYVANCQRIASEFGCCVMPVHHMPKNPDQTDPRGHSSLKGGVDTLLMVDGGKSKRVTVTKQKNAEEGDPFGFKLLSIELGDDEDGEPVTSCIVEAAELTERAVGGLRLNDGQALALRALRDVIQSDGLSAVLHLPDQPSTVKPDTVARLSAWRDRYLEIAGDPEGKPDSARRAWDRYRARLQSIGIIECCGDFAWPKAA